jgi:hypothetical protein
MPKKEAMWVKASGWLFILGIVISVASVLVDIPQVGLVLLVLGVVIGILGVIGVGSIDVKECDTFLLAVVALMAAGSGTLDQLPLVGQWIGPIVMNIRALVMPAAVLIALRSIWKSAQAKF